MEQTINERASAAGGLRSTGPISGLRFPEPLSIGPLDANTSRRP